VNRAGESESVTTQRGKKGRFGLVLSLGQEVPIRSRLDRPGRIGISRSQREGREKRLESGSIRLFIIHE